MIDRERARTVTHKGRVVLLVTFLAILAGCASPNHRAPVEERGVGLRDAGAVTGADPATLPGAENAGLPGFYTVKPGDTIMRIGLETGQYWKDLIQWNALEQPNNLVVGQVLRVTPPPAVASPPAPVAEPVGSTAVATAPIGASRVEARPLDTRPTPAPASQLPSASASNTTTTTTAPAATSAGGATPQPTNPDDNLGWIWPATGPVVATFDENRNKGLGIAGKPGDPVLAAADGRVVYAGAGLRGYGNLVIVKHNNTFLTAYAHNQALLVKEDQVVSKGQRIAEMGSTDADRVKLHFEIRRLGRPVDPTKYLPPR